MYLMIPLVMFEQQTCRCLQPILDLPNYKKSAFYQRIDQDIENMTLTSFIHAQILFYFNILRERGQKLACKSQ